MVNPSAPAATDSAAVTRNDRESRRSSGPSALLESVSRWPARIWLVLLLGLHASLLAWNAAVHSPTLDEAFHLAGGVRHLKDHQHDIDRGNPPLVGTIAAIPVVVAGVQTDWHRAPDSFLVGGDFLNANGSRVFWLMTLGRWMLIPFSLLGLFVCYRWARELGGDRAGLLAATLWSLSPQVLTFGSLVTGDLAATALGLTTMYAFWKWLRNPCLANVALCGLAWGFTETTKFVWLVMYALLPLLWLAWRWDERRVRPFFKTVFLEFWQGLTMVLISLSIINCQYSFEGSCRPLKSYHVGQKVLRILGAAGEHESTARRWMGDFPLPLPENYVGGLDEITKFVGGKPPSFLRGEYRGGGWWYFYLYGWMVKLPLGTWLLIGLALASLFRPRVGLAPEPDRESLRYLFRAAVGIMLFVTLTSGVQFLRYTLPVLPLVFIWIGQLATHAPLRSRGFRSLIFAGLAWTIGSTLLQFPHTLSYYNELVGGPRYGYRHLIDDSYDWGQDLLLLRKWLNKHPEAKPLRLAYWGWTDPRLAGIDYVLPPLREEVVAAAKAAAAAEEQSDTSAGNPIASPLTAGWYACSIGLSHGGPWIRIHDGTGNEAIVPYGELDYFRDMTPVASAGYSIRIFHLDEATAARISKDLLKTRPKETWESILEGPPPAPDGR